jgi:hypothetical protein
MDDARLPIDVASLECEPFLRAQTRQPDEHVGRCEGFGTNAPDSQTNAGTILRASLYARTFSGFASRQRRVDSTWQLEHQDDNPSRVRRLRRNSLFFFRARSAYRLSLFFRVLLAGALLGVPGPAVQLLTPMRPSLESKARAGVQLEQARLLLELRDWSCTIDRRR